MMAKQFVKTKEYMTVSTLFYKKSFSCNTLSYYVGRISYKTEFEMSKNIYDLHIFKDRMVVIAKKKIVDRS